MSTRTFRAFIFAPREAFADLFDGDYQTTKLRCHTSDACPYHSVDLVLHIDNCDELKPEWLHMAKVMSEEHFSQEVQQQNALARVIKENLVDQSLGRFADVAVRTGEHRFYRQSYRGKRRKCVMVAPALRARIPNKVAELVRFLMRRCGGEQINEECLDRMKEGQSGILYVTGATAIPTTGPSIPLLAKPSMVALRKNDLVVTYTVDPLSGCAMQMLHKEPRTFALELEALGGMLGRGAPCFIRPDDSDTSNSERCTTTGTGSSTTATAARPTTNASGTTQEVGQDSLYDRTGTSAPVSAAARQ